jgi:hypothetical protein
MLGRQPVVHRCDGDAQFPAEAQAQPVVLLRAADHVAATVDPQQRRARLGGAGRPIEADTHTGSQGEYLDVTGGATRNQWHQRPHQRQGTRTHQSSRRDAGE